jgi:hypothetical protein
MSISPLYGQVFPEEKTLDVVYVQDGSILKGKIIENFVDRYIKIAIFGGSTFTVSYEHIDAIEEVPNPDYNTRWIQIELPEKPTGAKDEGSTPDDSETYDARQELPTNDHLAHGHIIGLSASIGVSQLQGNDWDDAMQEVNAKPPYSGPGFRIGTTYTRLRQLRPASAPWWMWGLRTGLGYSRHRLDYEIDNPEGEGRSDFNFITDLLELPAELLVGGGGRRLIVYAGFGVGASLLLGTPESVYKGGDEDTNNDIDDLGHPSGNDPDRRIQGFFRLTGGTYIRIGTSWTVSAQLFHNQQ